MKAENEEELIALYNTEGPMLNTKLESRISPIVTDHEVADDMI